MIHSFLAAETIPCETVTPLLIIILKDDQGEQLS